MTETAITSIVLRQIARCSIIVAVSMISGIVISLFRAWESIAN